MRRCTLEIDVSGFAAQIQNVMKLFLLQTSAGGFLFQQHRRLLSSIITYIRIWVAENTIVVLGKSKCHK